ncbi:MAG TPA: hypothetical protein VJQ08_08695 [Candidatus Dormibacteraeota bacterium]|nr:hypothetical protein [Candidatus Dormibacteraeota bacterium]
MASHVGNDWRDQWDRIRRWHIRVRMIGDRTAPSHVLPGPEMGGPGLHQEFALDAIYAFFMNCYHLRDWLIKSDQSITTAVDAWIEQSDSLKWCRDICNGMKHCKLNPAMPTTTYQNWTTTAEPKVVVSGVETRPEPVAGFYWSFEDPSSGVKRDMFQLADSCISDWAAFLKSVGLSQ